MYKLTVLSDYAALWKRQDSHLEFCCIEDIYTQHKKNTYQVKNRFVWGIKPREEK